MAFFKVILGSRDVTNYVHADSLSEWKQSAESDSIWEFRTDNISVTFDNSILDRFEYFNWDGISSFFNLPVEVYYYDEIILRGIVSDARYNLKTDEIEMEFESNATNFINFTIPSQSAVLQNDNPQGESLEEFTIELVDRLQRFVVSSELPLTTTGQYNIQLGDFTPLKNITVSQLNLILTVSLINAVIGSRYPDFRLLTIDVDDLRYVLKRDDEGTYWLAFYIERADNDPHVWLAQMGDAGFTGRLLYDIVRDTTTIPGGYREALDVLDNAILNSLISEFNLPENWTPDYAWASSNSVYYAFDYNGFIWKAYQAVIGDEDRVRFRYKSDTSVGEAQKDFARLFNMLTWYSPDGTLNYITRDGNSEAITIRETAIDLDFQIERRNNERFEIPEAFVDYLTEQTRNDIVEYYDQYLSGLFYVYTVSYDREAVPQGSFPMMLKNLRIPINGIFIDIGIIKQITYEEDIITFKTERRIDG